MAQEGTIKIEDGESIKIVAHSQGVAHSLGFIEQPMAYKDAEDNSLYNIEVLYAITPHQPEDMHAPEGIRTVQYSHPNYAVSSNAPWWLSKLNGGSENKQIQGAAEFYNDDIMGGEGQPPCEGPVKNRCGHNVTDNAQYIKQTESIQPRKDAQ